MGAGQRGRRNRYHDRSDLDTRAPAPRPSVTVLYSCKCSAVIAPHKGRMPDIDDDVFCTVHNKTVQVIVVSDTYRISCDDCRYSRSFGAARMTADTYAAKHSVTRMHKVRVYRSNKLLHTMGENRTQLVLGDDPPF